MLAVCTSSTELALITTQQLRDVLGTTSTSDDSLMQSMCNRATAELSGYLGYPLIRNVYSETVAGFGSNELQVSRVPVLSVESIYYSTQLVESTSYVIDNPSAGILSRDLGWAWTAGLQYELTGHVAPNSELKRFTIVYEAGYALSGSTAAGWLTTGEPVPYEIEDALLAAATFRYKAKSRDLSITSKRIGDLSISYAENLTGGLPNTITNLVQHLRRF